MFKTAVILAAGRGERMMPLTADRPKALVSLAGQPLIQYTLNTLRWHGVEEIYVTYGWHGKKLLPQLGSKVEGFINTTGQGNAAFLSTTVIKYIREPILVCPCDLVFDIDLKALWDDCSQRPSSAIQIVPISAHDNADFIHTDHLNTVIQITREKPSGLCASGIQVINPARIHQLMTPSTDFYTVWSSLISWGSLSVANVRPDLWQAFDTKEDLEGPHDPWKS